MKGYRAVNPGSTPESCECGDRIQQRMIEKAIRLPLHKNFARPLLSFWYCIVELLSRCFHRCLSIHRGGCTPARHTPTWTDTPPRADTPLWADTHLTPARPPPPSTQTATTADGTHPTGMHSSIW